MPNGKRICFIFGAAIYPTWTALALVLQFTTVCTQKILLAIVNRKLPRKPLIVFSEAVDMHVEARIEGSGSGLGRALARPPFKIPFQELQYFKYQGTSTSGAAFVPTRTNFSSHLNTTWAVRKNHIGLATTTCLTLAYLAQALITIYLVSRRANFDQSIWQTMGLPVIPGQRWPPFGRMPLNAMTTFADTQAFGVAILGTVIALPYLLLQIFDIRWDYINNDSLIWTYERDDRFNVTRSMIGMFGVIMSELQIGATIGPTASWKLLVRILEPFAKVFGSTKPESLIAYIPATACLAWAAGSFLRKWLNKRPSKWLRALAHILTVPACYLRSFDYSLQFPIICAFVSDKPNGSHTMRSATRRAELKYKLYLFVYFAPGVALYTYNISSLARNLVQQTRRSIPAVTAQSGCIYTTQLYPWMWKDPLADQLWAF